VTDYPFQNRFGNNMRPMGGSLGGASGFGLAVEHQTLGPPHAHGNIHLANAYQFNTLYDIAQMIKDKVLDPQSVLDFHARLHREEPFDQTAHESQREHLEDGFRDRFDASLHDPMSQMPAFLHQDVSPSMYETESCNIEAAKANADTFEAAYRTDLQCICSRVQHHFHKETEEGYVPLPRACACKKDKSKCKHTFPKEKQFRMRMRVSYMPRQRAEV
jgi:hypothetical protein